MARRTTSSSGEQFRIPDPASLAPVYLIYGEEDLLVEDTVRGLMEAAVPEESRGFNLDVLQGADADVRDIVARASAFPMMAERRAVVVRDVDKLGQKDLELLAPYIEHPAATTVLILTGVKPDLRRKAYALINKAGNAVEYKLLTEAQLPAWITRRAKEKKRSIDPDACRLLSSLVGRALRELDHELDKLVIYAGERTTITAEDVSAVVGVSRQYNIFEFQRAIAAGDIRRADEILGRMLEAGNGAPYFVVMLSAFFSTVWKMHDFRRRGTSDEAMPSSMKRERWMIADHLTALNRYSPYQVERALGILLTVDERSKSGGDEVSLLHAMLAEIMAECTEMA